MGIDDAGGLADKAREMLSGHEDQVDDALDKAADVVKDKTPDNVDGIVDTVAEKAKDVL